jgi:hypothetical protein
MLSKKSYFVKLLAGLSRFDKGSYQSLPSFLPLCLPASSIYLTVQVPPYDLDFIIAVSCSVLIIED